MSHLLKNLLIALGLAVTLFVGYIVVRDSGGDDYLLESKTSFSAEAELETQQLLATLNELKSFNVRGDIFTDPIFLSLKDFRLDLGQEPSGRPNPFEQTR